jgi:hypothetical protein
MKKLGLALAAMLGFTVLTPATAEAGGCRTRVTYDSCGNTLHWEYRFVGRDCHGCPVFRWVVVSRCAPQPPCHDHGYSNGYSGGGYYSNSPRYVYPGGGCGRGHSGISFHFGH